MLQSYIIRLVNSMLLLKTDFLTVMYLLYSSPARELKYFSDFGSIVVALASSNSRKHVVAHF